MIVKLLTEHHLEFLSLKGGCTGSSESTNVKMPHCWKSHALAQLFIIFNLLGCRVFCCLPTAFNIINIHAQFYKRTLNACGFIVRMKNREDPDRVLNCFQARIWGDGRKTTNYSFPGITHISPCSKI